MTGGRVSSAECTLAAVRRLIECALNACTADFLPILQFDAVRRKLGDRLADRVRGMPCQSRCQTYGRAVSCSRLRRGGADCSVRTSDFGLRTSDFPSSPHLNHFGFTGRQGAGLVEYHSRDVAGLLQGHAVADQDAALSGSIGAGHDGCGRGEAHSARAGDDEHRGSDDEPGGEPGQPARGRSTDTSPARSWTRAADNGARPHQSPAASATVTTIGTKTLLTRSARR